MRNSKPLTKLHIPNFNHELEIFSHPTGELISDMLQQEKIWEAYETKLIIDNLKTTQTFLDIGANIGYYSLIASPVVGNSGQVLAFEPDTDNYQLLLQNLDHNQLKNVRPFNFGLGESDHSQSFFLSPENRGDHRCFDWEQDREEVKVQIKQGDQLLPNYVQKIHFIKIDTQGFELKILKGLKQTLTANANHLKLIVEFWPFALRENGDSATALINELNQYNFRFYIIDHIDHKLIKSNAEELIARSTDGDLNADTQGFINLFLEYDG